LGIHVGKSDAGADRGHEVFFFVVFGQVKIVAVFFADGNVGMDLRENVSAVSNRRHADRYCCRNHIKKSA
jgi:hypothetical protein